MLCPSCRRRLDQEVVFRVEARDDETSTLQCVCGAVLSRRDLARARETAAEPEVSRRSTTELSKQIQQARARKEQGELGQMADKVCFLIVSTDYPEVDVRIEQEKVRARCEELFPDRMELYEMIYESRFERLWSQFR
jgi:hypothetical protein